MSNFLRPLRTYLIVVLICLGTSLSVRPQDVKTNQSEIRSRITQLSRDMNALKRSNDELQRTAAQQRQQIENLTKQLSTAQQEVTRTAESLRTTDSKVISASKETQGQIQGINQAISTRTLYWIIGILVVALLSVFSFFTLRKRLASNAKDLHSQITRTKDALEAEAIKLDSKLVEILQTQLSISEVERNIKPVTGSDMDHRLPLKVGDEIHRMRKRIAYMPQEVKGLGALSNSLKRLEEEFNDNGYELEELLGTKYVDGMKIEARFVDNPDIPAGEEIITDVLRPRIKYKGQVIQIAKVEVGKSY
jgi:outer membrane murein-binding lipoprotein Lpp